MLFIYLLIQIKLTGFTLFKTSENNFDNNSINIRMFHLKKKLLTRLQYSNRLLMLYAKIKS